MNNLTWNKKYWLCAGIALLLWVACYTRLSSVAGWLVYSVFGLQQGSQYGAALQFFFYDSVKIFFLLILMVYVLAWLRSSLNVERVRLFLQGKRRGAGYFLGAAFGAVTPFCSCSSVPLFLGFSVAGIPLGITMSFLITSPIINEIAVVLLWGLLGWKFTLVYVCIGIAAGIAGGAFMDSVKGSRWLQPFLLEAMNGGVTPANNSEGQPQHITLRMRHDFAYTETKSIVKRVWKWIIIGVSVGAALHGFVPDEWFATYLGAGRWWSVPASVLVGIPLYTNVTGIVPVMESLILKGLPLGTTLAFCMSSVAASLPELLMLKQVMRWQLLALFLGYVLIAFTITGWVMNALEPYVL
ncbi:permease [Desulfovibrio sp. OttesenSCG-928-F07]|nr:permease [Desulfovibrio sp. OttesenSCG-928-F07]